MALWSRRAGLLAVAAWMAGAHLPTAHAGAQLEEPLMDSVRSALQAAVSDLSPPEPVFTSTDARLHYLRWPVQGPILISYGSPRTAELKWKGTLIGASEGTQVKAVAPGQVVYADWLDGFGMLLVIDHGKGYMSLYGHNQSLLRQVGQKVEQGEPVALVGDSGGQERSGLYFEIRYQGEAINPTKWLARR